MKTKSNDKNKIDQPNKDFIKESNIFETTYEKVLSIINQVKEFIKRTSKSSQKLIDDLEWVIKVITNKSLYSYEVKKSKNAKNEEYNKFINFVTKYNEEVLELNKRHILVSSIFGIRRKGDILIKPSLCLKKILPEELKTMDYQKEKEKKIRKKNAIIQIGTIFLNMYYRGIKNKKKVEENEKQIQENQEKQETQVKQEIQEKKGKEKEKDKKEEKNKTKKGEKGEIDKKQKFEKIDTPFKPKMDKRNTFNKISLNTKIKNNSISLNEHIKKIKKINTSKNNFNKVSINDTDKKNYIEARTKMEEKTNFENYNNKYRKDRRTLVSLNKKLTLTSIKKAMQNYYTTHADLLGNKYKKKNTNGYFEKDLSTEKLIKSTNVSRKKLGDIKKIKNLDINQKSDYLNIYTNPNKNMQVEKKEETVSINALIDKYFNDIRTVIDKDFNIFDFKKKVGYRNVLPIMGTMILKTLGLYDSKIISLSKLNSFLYTVSDNYIESTLYHNSLHGSDVTQSLCIFFINSNAEEISETSVLDLLSIIVSAMGHDLGHPGFNNNYHINAFTDLALTYNDASCLENYHTSFLFRILQKDENNILEKFNKQNHKDIRKRMISQILATDMANHGEVVSLIRAKIKASEEEGENRFNLLSGNEKSKFDEQQMLFNYLIHAADLGHNCKKFNISLKWVELLSEEFWMQGDMEKSKGMPISFLCDRDKVDIPSSQIGFIRAFIITTYDCLVYMFPSLKYTLDYANKNLKEWQKLLDQHRAKGWTPKKEKKEEKK